jgi:hypothetical protein
MRALWLASPAVLALLLSACASTPVYRPAVDLPGKRNVEIGAGLDVAVGVDSAGGNGLVSAMPGTTAWAAFRTEAGFDLFGAGRINGAVAIADGSFAGTLINAQAGVRYRVAQNYLEDMRFAFEVWGDYLQLDLSVLPVSDVALPQFQQYASGMVRAFVAQRAGDGVWVYIAPTTGLTLPLHPNDPRPFSGVLPEIPLGVVFQPFDLMSFVVEGGYSPLLQGGYVGGALMVQL